MERQIARLQMRLFDLEMRSGRYSWLRLAVFFGGVGLSAVFFFLGYLPVFGVALVLTLILFAIVAYWHRQIDGAFHRHLLWLEIKRTQVARANLDWTNLPSPEVSSGRPMELDLDITGPNSVHRLTNTAVSYEGSLRLLEWLTTPVPDPGQIDHRQVLVKELAPLSLFRDRLTLSAQLADEDGGDWSQDHLLNWLSSHRLAASIFPWLILLSLLAVLNLVLLVLNLAGFIPPLWQLTFPVYVLLFLFRSRELGEPFREAAQLRDGLEQLVSVFQRLESFGYSNAPSLKQLCQPFLDETNKPTLHLARVKRVLSATGIRGNPFFWLVLNAVMPWDYLFSWLLDRSKGDLADHLPGWLDIWHEIEALSSLANLSYLNPQYTFPEFNLVPGLDGSPVFAAESLGHPLIPDGEKVCNDFAIDSLGAIVLISGSNMSGKSTFLRTVSINLALGQAGGPMDAAGWRSTPFRLHTCIRISDSVTDGISYFYAEVKCLRSLLDALEEEHPLPLFYFIDEIFRGTNNRERLIGSRAFIRALSGQNGIGLLSTHDLELVALEDEVPGLINLHFRDDLSDGLMVFSYKLTQGASPTTNALKIMAQEGLPL